MAVNYSINKKKEPEDNMRYAERKAARMVTNGLSNQSSDDKLLSKEKKDFEMLKVKESKRDIFGPLTTFNNLYNIQPNENLNIYVKIF